MNSTTFILQRSVGLCYVGCTQFIRNKLCVGSNLFKLDCFEKVTALLSRIKLSRLLFAVQHTEREQERGGGGNGPS